MKINLEWYKSNFLSTKDRYVRLSLGHTIWVGWKRFPLLCPMFYCEVQVSGLDPQDVTADTSHE